MHIVVSLLSDGARVATIDLDARQGTFTRYIENRAAYARRRDIALPLPEHQSVVASGDPADEKGRWGMIGLRTGIWTFTVEAPGFETGSVSLPIRSGANNPAPLRFVLQRTPEPIPGALVKNIEDEIARAGTLRSGVATSSAAA